MPSQYPPNLRIRLPVLILLLEAALILIFGFFVSYDHRSQNLARDYPGKVACLLSGLKTVFGGIGRLHKGWYLREVPSPERLCQLCCFLQLLSCEEFNNVHWIQPQLGGEDTVNRIENRVE